TPTASSCRAFGSALRGRPNARSAPAAGPKSRSGSRRARRKSRTGGRQQRASRAAEPRSGDSFPKTESGFVGRGLMLQRFSSTTARALSPAASALAISLAAALILSQPAFAQASPFLTGATALESNILAWLTPIAVILVMVL